MNVDRLSAADIATYNAYVDTDAAAVATKTDIAATASQTAGGAVTITIEGLANGTDYFLAVEAEDSNGNISATRTTTLADGSPATGTPQATVGPAGLSGETGCGMVPGAGAGKGSWMLLGLLLILLAKRRIGFVALFFAMTMVASVQAAEREISKPWGVEFQTGFWVPASSNIESFYGQCCNLIFDLEWGYYFQNRYGIVASAGIFSQHGTAVGLASGGWSASRACGKVRA